MVICISWIRAVVFEGTQIVTSTSSGRPASLPAVPPVRATVLRPFAFADSNALMTLALLPPELEDADLDTQVKYRTLTGRPVPMVQIRIVDENMNDVPHDGKAQGEVVARAPWLTQGYLHDKENSEHLWHGGWLHTGDIATMTPDGWLKIADRIKDVIIDRSGRSGSASPGCGGVRCHWCAG